MPLSPRDTPDSSRRLRARHTQLCEDPYEIPSVGIAALVSVTELLQFGLVLMISDRESVERLCRRVRRRLTPDVSGELAGDVTPRSHPACSTQLSQNGRAGGIRSHPRRIRALRLEDMADERGH